MSIALFCRIFANYFNQTIVVYSYQSYTYGKRDGAEYLTELITQYNAFDKEYIFQNLILCIEKASGDLTFTTYEQDLCDCIKALCPNADNETIVNTNTSLGKELKIFVAFYE